MLSDNYYRQLEEEYQMSPGEVAALARKTAEKAIELDPDLAEGHAALSNVMLQFDWDWRGAEAELRKAIELNPSYARAHKLLGHQVLSGALRRHEEGISEVQLAVKLDPWSPSNQSSVGWAYYHAERFEEALAQFRKTWEMFPEQIFTGVGVSQSLMMTGHREEAVSTMEKTAAMRPGNPYLQGFLAWTYGAAGLADKARSVIEEIQSNNSDDPPALPLAWGYTGLGDKEMALDWLERAYENRDFDLVFVQAPEFRQVLAAEPRSQQLREKMRLEGPRA
jgi:tetratricopeptide (TPR) repeat protein